MILGRQSRGLGSRDMILGRNSGDRGSIGVGWLITCWTASLSSYSAVTSSPLGWTYLPVISHWLIVNLTWRKLTGLKHRILGPFRGNIGKTSKVKEKKAIYWKYILGRTFWPFENGSQLLCDTASFFQQRTQATQRRANSRRLEFQLTERMAPPRQQGLGWKIFWALGDATTQPCYKESSLTKSVGYKRIWVIYFTHFPIWRRLKSQSLNLWREKLKPILITTTWDSLSPHIKYWSLAVAYPSQITSG